MARPKIAIVGSANIDLTTFTDEFPRPGETIFGREFNLGFGGKGANQAVAARLCGADVAMVARVGDDLFGEATVHNFESQGIDASHVRVTKGASSGVAPIFVDRSGQNRIIVVKGANDLLSPADVDAAADLLSQVQMMILQLEVPLDTVYHTLRFARAHGIQTIVNPAPAIPVDLKEFANADYVIPNESEATALSGVSVGDLASARIGAKALLDAGVPRVIVTLGENGSLIAASSGMEHIAPFRVRAVDTTGAGDAFIGSLAVFLSSGFTEREAVSRANLYAALSTLAVGTQKSFVNAERFEMEWSARAKSAMSSSPGIN